MSRQQPTDSNTGRTGANADPAATGTPRASTAGNRSARASAIAARLTSRLSWPRYPPSHNSPLQTCKAMPSPRMHAAVHNSGGTHRASSSAAAQGTVSSRKESAMLNRTILALAALASVSVFDSPSAEAQQWAPAGGPYATVSQRPVQYQPVPPATQVRYQAAAFPAPTANAPAGYCNGCGNSAAFCNCAPGACANGLCPQGCHCANGRCQCVNGECRCANGQCGCICPPGACERGECVPGCPCPCCNGSRATSSHPFARPAGLSGATSQSVARPITHTTLRRPVIADTPDRMVTASL